MENRCFLCNLTSTLVVYKEKGFESVRCLECGLLYCNPLPANGEVDFENESHIDSFYKRPSQYKSKWLAKRIGVNKRLLEVGAGNGHLLNEFYNCGYEVSGLEPNIQRISNIEKVYHLQTHAGYLESYDFKEEKFDIVYHVDLLAHFPDPMSAIQKMKDVLSKDGYISFEVGVVGGISSFWYNLFPLGLPQHRWLYSRKSLVKLFKEAELFVVYSTS
ncbi:MAG: class I SAM-dependent methyltransferase, partial [Flavobacterium sp.]